MVQWIVFIFLTLSVSCANNQPTGNSPPTETEPMSEETPAPSLKEVTFDAAGVTVSGTLTYAGTNKPSPAIVLIAGSGPTDRNWESPLLPGKNGSARLLADALANRGIASLRYDKRGTGETKMPTEPLSWAMYVQEIQAAVALLKADPNIDNDQIFLGGHSEGGAHAIKASTEVDVAGVALLAASGRSLGEIMNWQIDQQLATAGVPELDRKQHAKKLQAAFDEIAAGKDIDVTKASTYPGVQNLVKSLMAPSSGTFVKEILAWDPAVAIKDVPQPVLILNGDKDIQVDHTIDAPKLRDAKPDATYVIVPDADHVLKSEPRARDQLTAQVGLAYNAAGRELSTGVVDALVSFIDAQRAAK